MTDRSSPLGVAILGCGKMGSRHAEAVTRAGEVRLVAVADVDRAAADRVAGALGATAAADLDALLQRADVDVVVVATPTALHGAHVRAALAAGRHVLCEKPLSTTRAEVDDLYACAARVRRALAVGYVYRYAAPFAWLREAVRAGALGRPHLALMRIGARGDHRGWKHGVVLGGGAITDVMSHMVDLAVWLFGAPSSAHVLSRGTLLPERIIDGRVIPADAEDYAVAELSFAGGPRCLVQADLTTPAFAQTTEVHGENGSAFASLVDALPTRLFLKTRYAGYPPGWSMPVEHAADPLDAQWRCLAAELRRGDYGHWREESDAVTHILERLARGA